MGVAERTINTHEEIPEPDELRAELAKIVATGCSISDLPATPTLLSLAMVATDAKSNKPIDRRIALVDTIREAIEYIGVGPTGIALRELLGLTSHTRGLLAKDRRELAADALGVQPETFRKNYERRLLQELADELYRLEAERRIPLRIRRPKRGPASALDDLRYARGDKSLARREAEAHLWALGYELRADLLRVARLQDEHRPDDEVAEYVNSSLHRYARFYEFFARFTDDFGTSMVVAGSEVTVREVASLLQLSTPLADDDALRLRSALVEGDWKPPSDILATWRTWLQTRPGR